jgi:formate/nitrite transporter FocA (FNT family)
MKRKYFNYGFASLMAGFLFSIGSYFGGTISADATTSFTSQYMLFTIGFIVGFVLIVLSAIFFVLASTGGQQN